jgi:uncharacterized protein
MVQMASRATPEKRSPSRRRAPGNRRIDKRPGKSPGKAGGGGFGFPFLKITRPSRLLFLLVWLVAVAALAGLVYWGKSSKPILQPRTEVAAKSQGTSPNKVFDHREIPKASEAKHQQTAANHGSQQNTGSPEKHLLEPQQPITARPTPATEPRETHATNHFASRAPEPGTNAPQTPLAPSQHPSPVLTPPVARVAIVIDDFGMNLDIAKKFLEVPLPITFSILPHQRFSQEIAELAHDHHRQVILHLPMEPQGYPKVNPGKGALFLSMSGDALQQSLSSALDSSPYIAGINNHMGSRFTENAPQMKTVMEEAKKRGLYFLDSFTSPRSVAASVAQQVHIAFLRRDVFLDNNPSEAAIRAQLRQLIRRAKIQGSALAIGHPHESTLRALGQEVGEFEREKIAVVPAGELLPEL